MSGGGCYNASRLLCFQDDHTHGIAAERWRKASAFRNSRRRPTSRSGCGSIGALIIFRLLSYVPLPGVDPTALGLLSQQTQGGVLDFFNTFSGGSLSRMSLIALGVMPYITASIVVQLATSLSPTLAAIKKDGESGRKRLNQYTRYGTVGLIAVQGYFIAVGLETLGAAAASRRSSSPGMMFRVAAVISLIGGTMFLMWLGEQITSRGIGNGVSLIIMAGIVAHLPVTLVNLLEGGRWARSIRSS